jgi:broad specificity phosphatase PhoE
MHLPEPLIALAVDAVDVGERVCLVVRHAARGPIHDLARHHEVPLTDDGHACAVDGGRRLGGRLRRATTIAWGHSPVHRCRQTALGLARGLAAQGHTVVEVGADDGLGPDYLHDPDEVVRQYSAGGHAFVRRWFDGAIDPRVIAPRAEVTRRMLGAVDALLDAHPLSVAVTHDWNVAAVREESLALRLEQAGWPAFLDGFVVVRAAGGRAEVRGVALAAAA